MTVLANALNRAYEALEPLNDARQIAERGNLYLLARAIHMVRNVLERGLTLLTLIAPHDTGGDTE